MASPTSTLSSADSDIEAPPPRPPSTGTKRAASIAFSDQSPASSHPPRRRPPPPQPSPSSNTNNLNNHHLSHLNNNNHHAVDEDDRHHQHPPHHIHQHATSLSDISSDTSGSVPGSPRDHHHNDDGEFAEQVTVCKWAGCNEDLGNMDDLVKHIHDDHIGSRKAKYACEWDDCTRKGMTHASGYALRAHMRSHTREKPFYCSLPECDRSFTRSDALAKHMRTVHETEALRPSDPIPKSHPNHPQNIANSAYVDALFRRQTKALNAANHGDGIGGVGGGAAGGFRVLNLATLSNNSTPTRNGFRGGRGGKVPLEEDDDGDEVMENGGLAVGGKRGGRKAAGLLPSSNRLAAVVPAAAAVAGGNAKSFYPPTDPFSPDDESHRPPKELYKYLKQKLKWVQERQEALQTELDGYVRRRREGWIKKELLLERMLEMELGEDARLVSIYVGKKGKKKEAAGGAVKVEVGAGQEEGDAKMVEVVVEEEGGMRDVPGMGEEDDGEDAEEEDEELKELKRRVAAARQGADGDGDGDAGIVGRRAPTATAGGRVIDEDIDIDDEDEPVEEVDEYATEEE